MADDLGEMAARSRQLLVMAVLLLAAVSASDSDGAAGPLGVIAFEAPGGLYTVAASGGEPRRIPGTLHRDGNPRWSPDGRRLSFDRYSNGNWDVYVIDADGSNQRQLTFSTEDDDFATWAPHGRSLVFMSERDDDHSVYAIDVSSGAARRVTRDGRYPDWMPDGRILFTDEQTRTLHTVRPYGADRRSLPTRVEATAARISDDGKMIVLQAKLPAKIYTARSDGSQVREQAASRHWNVDPVLSPDSSWIIFDSTPSRLATPIDIYIIPVNGKTRTRLTTTGNACCADWSATATRR